MTCIRQPLEYYILQISFSKPCYIVEKSFASKHNYWFFSSFCNLIYLLYIPIFEIKTIDSLFRWELGHQSVRIYWLNLQIHWYFLQNSHQSLNLGQNKKQKTIGVDKLYNEYFCESTFDCAAKDKGTSKQADIKWADGRTASQGQSHFVRPKVNEIYNQINIGLNGSNLRWPHTKHCQVEVQEKYFLTSYIHTRKLANNDFQYHRDVIYSV